MTISRYRKLIIFIIHHGPLKKSASKLFAITFANINRFDNFCTKLTSNELRTSRYQYFSLHRACVSTLPCKIRKQRFLYEHWNVWIKALKYRHKILTTPRLWRRHRLTDDVATDQWRHPKLAVPVHTTASYHCVVWTGTARCGWRHWSVATSSVSLCWCHNPGIVRILCRYFDAFMQIFQCSC